MKKALRGALEKFSRGRVLKLRLPARFGGMPIFVSPDAGLRFWKHDLGAVCESLGDLAERFVFPGSVVWDVGANVGLFAFCAAFKAGPSGRVLAIEPDLFLAQLIRGTAAASRGACADVAVLPVAVSEAMSVQEFAIAARGRAANFLPAFGGSTQTGGVRETVHVVTVTLDWLASLMPPPDLLKIDVERAELAVLKGADGILRNNRPVILCEVGPENSENVSALLHSNRYGLFDSDDMGKGLLQSAPRNVLAVPEEKTGDFKGR